MLRAQKNLGKAVDVLLNIAGTSRYLRTRLDFADAAQRFLSLVRSMRCDFLNSTSKQASVSIKLKIEVSVQIHSSIQRLKNKP